jgi:F-type H+-transporting ATPase subunit b
MNKSILFLLVASLPLVTWASDEHSAAVPVATIIYQTINFVIIVAGLWYFLKNPMKNYFKTRRELFIAASEKSHLIKKQAEAEHADIEVRLTKLESTIDESISRAHAEAADMKKGLIQEADLLSSKIKLEAQSAAEFEVEKAKNKIREQLITQASLMAKELISSKINSEDQKRLQADFIKKIEAVRS